MTGTNLDINIKTGGHFNYEDDFCIVKEEDYITYVGCLDYCPYKNVLLSQEKDDQFSFKYDENLQVYIGKNKENNKQEIFIIKLEIN